jgi:hypothetical protein
MHVEQLPIMNVECTAEMLAVADIIAHVLSLTDDDERQKHNLRTFEYIIEARIRQLASVKWGKMSLRKRNQNWKRLTCGTMHLLIDAMRGFTKSERQILSNFIDGRTNPAKAAIERKEKAAQDQAREAESRAIALREIWDELRKAED